MYLFKRLLFILHICILFATVNASNLYPEWFLYPQKYPAIHIGYTYNGSPEILDAQRMYCAYSECIVLGTLEILQTASDDEYLKHSDYFYYFSPDSLLQIEDRLKSVDRFCVSTLTGDFISAFILDSTYNLSAPTIQIEDIPKPEWRVKDFWADEQYYYGVGTYTSLGSESDAWKTAEERAIFNILTNLAVQYHKLQLVYDDPSGEQSMEQISFLKLKYLLRNIEFLERYPDRDEQLFFTLVRIPRADVISPFLK